MRIRYILLSLTIVLFLGCSNKDNSADQVCFSKTCFAVEVVQSLDERGRGLMFREHLDINKGMLFIFREPRQYNFWMKNTLIPLDIIWFDYTRKVVHIEKNVPPCKKDPCANYYPQSKALYVLEVNGGVTDTQNINVGDTAVFKLGLNSLRQ